MKPTKAAVAVEEEDVETTHEIWTFSSAEGKWFRNYWELTKASLDENVKELAIDYYSDAESYDPDWSQVDLGGATLYNCDMTIEEEDYDTGRLRDVKARLVVLANKSLKAREFLKIRKGIQDVVRAGILKAER